MLKSLGLVWIPGVMAGMMVSGASPVYGHISIRHRGNDTGRIGYYRIGRDAADENACFLGCRAIDDPSRHQKA